MRFDTEVAGRRARRLRATSALVPHAILEVLPGAGHLPWVEQPEAFSAAVERILDSTTNLRRP